jgi:hypothetical protein
VTPTVVQPVARPRGNGIADCVPDGYRTVSQVADDVGRSVDTLKRWRRSGTFVPEYFMRVGPDRKMKVWLYSENDVEQIRKQLCSPTGPDRRFTAPRRSVKPQIKKR